MLLNDTRLLTKETIQRLEVAGFMHVNVDGPFAEEAALEFLKWFEENRHIFEQE